MWSQGMELELVGGNDRETDLYPLQANLLAELRGWSGQPQKAAACPRDWRVKQGTRGLFLELLRTEAEPRRGVHQPWTLASAGVEGLARHSPVLLAFGCERGPCLKEFSFYSICCLTALLSTLQRTQGLKRETENKGCGFGNSLRILFGKNSYRLNRFSLILISLILSGGKIRHKKMA